MLEFYEKSVNTKVLDRNSKKLYDTKISVLASDAEYENLLLVTHGGDWKNIDWSVEPEETFINLLYQRCKQLRDKYEYLTLYYSGGADSETMLQSFIKSKTFIDEIVINNFTVGSINPLLDVTLAIKKLQSYQKNYLNKTKITINEITSRDFYRFLTEYNWQDSSFNLSIGNFRRMTLPLYKQIGMSISVSEKDSIGHIFAESKPAIAYREDKYFSYWGVPFGIGQWAEWFYTSLDLPELHLKQVHILYNWVKNQQIKDELITEHSNRRKQLIKLLRFPFNSQFQPRKAAGLLADLKKDIQSEDSLVIHQIEKYDEELYNYYTNQVVKDTLFNSNVELLDPYIGDLRRINTELFEL